MSRLKVAIDFDSTVADITPISLNHLNDTTGTNYKKAQMTDWYKFPGIVDHDQERFRALIEHAHRHPDLKFTDPYTWWALKRISTDERMDAYILTHNRTKEKDVITEWLGDRRVDIPVVTTDGRPKDQYEWDVLVDDNPELVCPEGRTLIRYPQPYNKAQSWVNWYEIHMYLLRRVIPYEEYWGID